MAEKKGKKEEEDEQWLGIMQTMLPPGASIPTSSDDLEYSFAMEYVGPPTSFEVPKVQPISPHSTKPKPSSSSSKHIDGNGFSSAQSAVIASNLASEVPKRERERTFSFGGSGFTKQKRMAAKDKKEEEDKAWQEIMQTMLPPGASIPTSSDALEYSFAMEYVGPPTSFEVPKVQPISPHSTKPKSSSSSSKHIDDNALSSAQSAVIASNLASEIPKKERERTFSFGGSGLAKQKRMAAKDKKEEEDKAWQEIMRTMVPPGAAISSDDDALSYSFAIEYVGPLPSFEVPNAQPISPHSAKPKPSSSKHIKGNTLPSSEFPKAQPISPHSTNPSSNHINGDGLVLPLVREALASPSDVVSRNTTNGRHNPTTLPPRTSFTSSEGPNDDLHGTSPSVADSLSSATASERKFRNSSDGENLNADFPSRVPIKETYPSPTTPTTTTLYQRKKGSCSGCHKTHLLQEREACIACGAKYCGSCLLQAMGSMPEGRKCVNCIGKPIRESKRPNMGKPSRILNRLLGPLEVQQIMKAERECLANQLRPEQVIVNGRELRPEEMAELLGCANPPHKLKPGSYWYDRQSGLWGKNGEKPDRLISPDLNVGDVLLVNASEGNTSVFINGREITRIELKLLKFGGVQCPSGTHLWVYPDGSFQEEGQNNMRGNIWGKAATKFLYRFLSLPVPRSHSNKSNDHASNTSKTATNYLEKKKVQKLLLLGLDGSGTSTIFKQAKYSFSDEGFSKEEIQNMKLRIQCNVYKYISIILEAREKFEEEEELAAANLHVPSNAINPFVSAGTTDASATSTEENIRGNSERKNRYSINVKLKHLADWFLEIMASGDLEEFFPAASREYAPLVEEMWKDPAIQATFSRRAELNMLPDVAEYFIERVAKVSTNEYEPSECDIIYAEGISQGSGVAELEFSLDDKSPGSESYNENYDAPLATVNYRLIRVSFNGMSEGCKWLDMFEDVRAVIFCVSLNEYDQMWTDGKSPPRNKMIASKELFESILTHPCFRDKPCVLFLTKRDLLEQKIHNVPLTACEWFSDFDPVRASHYTPQILAQQAYTYIAYKFKKLFENFNSSSRKLFTFSLMARDRSTVEEAIEYVREILKWDETKSTAFWNSMPEDSFTEMSSTSPLQEESA